MTRITVEYLAVAEEASAFCKDAAALKRLVQVDGSIKLNGNVITFTDGFTCHFDIIKGDVPDKGQIYFQLKFTKEFSTDPAEATIEQFSKSLGLMRGIIHKSGGEVTVLHDDTSRHYSMKSYPLIYEIENLMRRLIKNFMLINVGSGWDSEALPDDLKENVSRAKRKQADLLDSLDFIQLSNFLLKPISKKSQSEIYQAVQEATTLDDFNAVKVLLPQSNWQRHFAAIVECEDAALKKEWEELYELRCIVAHNAFIKSHEFQRIQVLTDELRPILEKALKKLPQVELSAEEKVLVKEARLQYIDRLPDRERLVVSLYEFEGLSFEEIGRVLTVSPKRVSQLYTQSVLRLRGYSQRDVSVIRTINGTYRGHNYAIDLQYAQGGDTDQYLGGAEVTVDDKPVFGMSTAGYVVGREAEKRLESDIHQHIDFLEDGEPQG